MLTIFPKDADLTSDENKNLALDLAQKLDDGNGKLIEYSTNTDLASQNLANFADSQKQVIQGTTKFKATLTSVGSVIKSVGASMLNMGIAMAASWAIGKAIEGIDYLFHYDENIIKAGQEAKDSIDNTVKSLQDSKQSLMDLGSSFGDQTDQIKTTGDAIDQVAEKYAELRQGVSNDGQNENVSLSTDEYQQYIDLSNQLAEQFPQLVAGYDSQGNAVLNLGKNADSAAASIRGLYEAQVASAHVDMGKNLQSAYDGIITQIGQIEDENTVLKDQMDAVDLQQNGELQNDVLNQLDSQFIKIDSRKYGSLAGDYFNELTDKLTELGIQWESMPFNTELDTETGEWYQDFGISIAATSEQLSELKEDLKDVGGQTAETFSSAAKQYSANELLIRDQWKSLSQTFGEFLQTSDAFTGLDQELQNAFLSSIGDLNLDALQTDYDGKVLPFLYERFIQPMADMKPEAQKTIADLLKVDPSELTLDDYKSKVDKAFKDAFGDDTEEQKEAQKQFENAYGIDSSIEDMEDNAERLKEAYADFPNANDFIDQMQTGDLSIAAQLIDNGSVDIEKGTDGLVSAIERYKKTVAESTDGPTLSSILGDSDNEVSSSIDSLQSDISSLSTALKSLKTGEFKDSDLTDLIQQFPQLASGTDDLQKSISNLKVSKVTDTMKKIDDAMVGASKEEMEYAKALKGSILKEADLSDIDAATAKQEIEKLFKNAYSSAPQTVAENMAKGFINSYSSYMTSDTGAQAMLKAVEQNIGNITSTGFDWGKEIQNFLPTTADFINNETIQSQLTDYQDKYQSLYQAQKDLKNGLMTGSTRKTFLDKFPDLAKYAGNTEDLSSAIDDLMDSMDSDVTNQFTDAIKTLQDAGKYADASALQSYVEAVLDGAHDIEGAYQKIAGLKIPTPQYAELKEALESSNEGDLYNELLSQYKTAKEAWKKGEVGTDDFKSFASIISPTGVSDAVNFGENQAMFERYFQDTSTGVENFLEDLQKLDLASNESGHWTSTLGNNLDEMRDAAQRLNMGFEPFMMMFGRLEDYGATTDFFTTEEDGQQHLSDLYQQIAEKKQKLAEIKADPDLAGDQSAIDSLNKDLDELYARVENTKTGIEELPDKATYYEAKNLEQAKSVITQMQDEINQAAAEGNDELVKILEKTRDQYLKENGYILKEQTQGQTQQGTIENPLAREFTNPTNFGDYETVIKKIQNATNEQTSSLKENLKVLSQYSESQLSGINLSDGQYDTGFEDAEQALDNLSSTFGLTKDQAVQLAAVLSDMGLIKATPKVDLTTVQDQIDNAKDELQDSNITVDLDFDISTSSKEELQKKSQEIQDELNNNASLSDSQRVSLQGVKDSVDNQVVTLTVQEKVEKDGDVDELLAMDDQTLATTLDLDVNNADQLSTARDELQYIKDNQDAQIDMTVKLDESQFKQLLGDGENASIDVTANNEEAKEKIDEAKNYAESQKPQMKIDGNNDPAINKGTSATQMINSMTGIIKVNADTSGMASAINSELSKPHTINISANVSTHVSGGTAKSTGTMIRVAHTDGTAYNVLNYTPAHASGNVTLSHDETALVNEEGQNAESIVRDGKWMIIPGGAHFENLKKGDLIFNKRQTSELINSGRVMSGGGHARAYAGGTIGAYAKGSDLFNWDKNRTQVGKSSSNSTSATKSDTKATKDHTSATKSSTKATKNAKKVWDWVEIRIKWWGKQVKKISDKITDYIDKSTKQSLLKQQMSKMNYEIGSNEKGAAAYMKKAKKVAKSYTYYNSDGTAIKTKVSKKYQKLVQQGAYRIEDMDTSTDKGKALAEAIEQYQTWYNKAQDCKQAVIDLKKEQMELFEQWANMPTEKAEKSIERLTAGFAGLNATQTRLSASQTGGSTQAAMVKATEDTVTQAKATAKQSKKAVTTATAANKKAQSKKKDANTELNKKKSKLLKTKGLSNAQKTAISKNQKIDTSKLKGTKKRRADAYNKALTNKKNADKAASTAKSNLNSAKSKYNTDQKIAEYLSGNVSEADAGYSSSDELSYMNTLVDKNVDNLKQVAKDRDEAYKESARNSKVYEAKYSTTVSTRDQYQKDKASGKTIASQYSKQLTKSQRNALKAGKTVSLKGIKDKDLLNKLKKYNTAVKNLPSAITAADDAQQQYNITLDAEKTAAENAAQAEIEAAQAVVQAVQDKFDNVKSYYEKQLSYQEQLNAAKEKEIDLSSAHGNYEKSSDYDVKISNEESTKAIKVEEKKKLEEQLQAGLKDGTIKQGTLEWVNMQTEIASVGNEIADCDTKIEELKQSKIGVYYEEQFDRAIDKIDQFKDRLDTLNGIISDDMKIDKNTGLLTEWGATSVMLNRNQFSANQKELKTLLDERKQIEADYKAGKFGEKTYNEKIKNVESSYNSLISSQSSLQNEMLSLIKNQAQAELDVLNKVISKRKEALQAKKDYYDYDKTLKNKTKDIQVLERQIAALQGSTNAADKARLAQLQEQLSDAQEDLSDTITDHAYSMQSDALDKLSSDMSDDFEKWSNDISSNVEKMSKAINEAVKNAGQSTAKVIGSITTILRNFGLTDDQIKTVIPDNITGYASGTNYVPKSGVYRVNEEGMESVFSAKYGTLTFLNQGDKVFDADFTKSLIDNAAVLTQNSQPQFGKMAKELENAIINIMPQSSEPTNIVYNIVVNEATDAKAVGDIVVSKITTMEKKRVRDLKRLR